MRGKEKKGAFELIAKVVAALPTHSQQRPFLLFFHFNFLLFSFVSSDSSQSERKKKKKTEQFFFFRSPIGLPNNIPPPSFVVGYLFPRFLSI